MKNVPVTFLLESVVIVFGCIDEGINKSRK